MTPLLLILLLFHLLGPALASGDYHERLHLQPLPPSSLLASFNFRSNETLSAFDKQNYRFFPRSLGQILRYASTRELHLRFTLGRWDAQSWGARPWGGAKEGGTGVELWAWVDAASDEEADARWTILTNALSGLFCASLNFIDSTRTVRPVLSFLPTGHHSNTTLSRLHLLHGTLPREPVCTENLTPFLKLLPCKAKAGISSLLDGHKLFDASWQSMSIDVRPLCPDRGECVVQIDQTVDMVLDVERSKRQRDNPIPRPVPVEELVCDTSKPYASDQACYPLDNTFEPAWSLHQVFGRFVKGTCPLAASQGDEAPETVCITVPRERHVFVSPGTVEQRHDDGYMRCYRIPAEADFDMVLPKQALDTHTPLSQPRLHAERTFTGYGQEHGGVQTILTNPSPDHAVEFVYLESLPWFMRTYLHTLSAKIASRGANTADDHSSVEKADQSAATIRELYYRPALDRHRPTHLEILLSVPANSSVILTYDFEKAILRYTEYPPDANRGFDIPPAVIRLTSASRRSGNGSNKAMIIDTDESVYLRTTTLLLSLPTPDFSMPYNVIILTSTVIALAFGSIFNILVRRFVGADEIEGFDLGRLKARARGRLALIRDRLLRRERSGVGTKEE